MSRFTKREQIAILLFVVGIISIIGYNVIMSDDLEISNGEIVEITNVQDNQKEEKQIQEQEEEGKTEGNSEKTSKDNKKNSPKEIIVIYISGQVHNPGIAKVPKGSRLYDALEQVGGLIKDTYDRDRINLARKVMDEEKIYIPKIGEELSKEDISDVTSSSSDENTIYYTDGKVDINKAPIEVLAELPGIGEVIAKEIINYRNRKEFTNINELNNVSGIGDKKFEKIKDLITID